MTRRSWMFAILAVWVVSLGWLVKRELFRPTGARLAAAALAVPPGALYYRLDVGNLQVGYSSTTIDTLPDALRVQTIYVLDVPALGKMHRTTARSTAMVSRALRLQSVDATFDGDIGQFASHGRIVGDSVLLVTIVAAADSQQSRIPLSGPFTLPALLPLRLAFGGEIKSGRSYSARLYDPVLLAGRNVTARVSAESTLIVPDSADLDSTTMTWVPEHFDTVRAFRIDHDANGGVPTRSWIDAQGRLVLASTDPGFATERAAFEMVYENFKHRDTVRLERNSATPAPGDIVPLTALAAGVTHVPSPRARLRLRLNGRDTLDVVQAPAPQPSYRLPSHDTAQARWLAAEPLIQSHDLRIFAQLRQIIQGERDAAQVAGLLTHWVHATVRRAATPPGSAGVPSALRALETRRGDCNDAALLFVALARAAGLPARTVAGLIYLDGRFYYHAWAEVFLNDWVAVDPTFDQFPADAARLPIARAGLARQAELMPLIGRLKLEVL